MGCPFCSDMEIQERILFSTEYSFAFLTQTPIVPGHTLISPKRHIATLDELSGAEWKDMWDMFSQVKQALAKTFQSEGFNFALNEGTCAGQTVPHIHFHILPRKQGDTGIIEYEPRKFLYRPGSREKTPQEELVAIVKNIKAYL